MLDLNTINLRPNEYTQKLCYYPFLVKLNRYMRSCITLNDLFNKICIFKQNRKFKFEWCDNGNK